MRRNGLASFESLERRLMLDGKVVVSISHGDLMITGDGNDNSVEVSYVEDDDGDFYEITGFDDTEINGGDSQTIDADAVRDDIRIDLKGGDNELFIGVEPVDDAPAFPAPDDLRIHTGNGDDSIRVENVVVGDDLTIHARDGFNDLQVHETAVAEDLELRGGDDGNELTVADSQIGEDLLLHGGDDSDVLGLVDSEVGEEAELDGEDGSDKIGAFDVLIQGDFEVNGDDGHDQVVIDDGIFGDDVWIRTDSGDDTVVLEGLIEIQEDLRIWTGRGNDQVFADPDRDQGTGGGGPSDELIIRVGEDAFLQMGSGHDEVFFTNLEVHDDLLIFGHSGDDAVLLEDVDVEEKLTVALNGGHNELGLEDVSFARRHFSGIDGDQPEIDDDRASETADCVRDAVFEALDLLAPLSEEADEGTSLDVARGAAIASLIPGYDGPQRPS